MSNTERPYGCGCYEGHLCHLCKKAGMLVEAEQPAECEHIGRRVPAASNREWRECLHPNQPLGGRIVCPCGGCGPKCSGYTV